MCRMFFLSSRRRHTRYWRDWSSDVCSSDLNPLGESLAAFKARHGVDTLAPTPHQFRPGRGLTGHERKGVSLLPVILAGPNWEWLRPPLAEAFAALAFPHQVSMEGFEVPLAYVAERVHRADV